jgi:phosphatidylglycerophosphate synthase
MPPTALVAAERYSPRPLTEGERWTALELAALRRRGYRAGAWVAFLRDSLRRSEETRRAHPAITRQAQRWGAIGAGAWVAAWRLGRGRLEPAPQLGAGLLWWASVWQMLDWHLGMAEGGDGVPRDRLARADAVTMARYWLVPLLPALSDTPRALPAMIALGGASDWLDGALARREGRTRLGRDLDTFADLFFISSATAAARRAQRLPPLAAGAVVARHGVGVAVATGAVLTRARRPAIRARRSGALLRFAGLALVAARRERTGTALLVVGCLTPPKRTAPQLSLA